MDDRTYYVTVEIELQATSPQEVREIIATRLATIADRFIVGDVEPKDKGPRLPSWPDQPEDYGMKKARKKHGTPPQL